MPTTNSPPEVSPLSDEMRMSTRDLMVNLGFEPVIARWTDQQPGYRYDFGNFVLEASQVMSMQFQPEMLFSGAMSTPRALRVLEFRLPLEVENYKQGVALIAHNIGRDFTPARECTWLTLGRTWDEHLPGRCELRAYERRPQCQVEADWFKVAVKKLVAAGAAATDDATFSLSFDNSVLRFELPGQVIVVPATGTSWSQTYRCRVKGLTHISKRTPSRGVSLSVWQDQLTIGRLRLPLEI